MPIKLSQIDRYIDISNMKEFLVIHLYLSLPQKTIKGTLILSPLQTALVQSKTMDRTVYCSYSVLKG